MTDFSRPETGSGDPPVIDGNVLDQLRQVVDLTSSIIAIKDPEGRYRYVNQAFINLLGGEAEDYLGRADHAIFPPALAERLRANDRRVFAENREIAFEEELHLHGQTRFFLTRKFPLRDPAGRFDGICLSAQDITETKRTDDALHSIALGISAATGPEVFELTVSNLARALGVDFAFVAAFQPGSDCRVLRTLAVCNLGAVGDEEIYALSGTPCERVLAEGYRYWSGSATAHFPEDSMLVTMGFTSYAGYPLVGAERQNLGVLSVCHSGPLPPTSLVETLLSIFAVRTGAELDRVRMDRALRESEASYRTIFEASDDCIFVHDIDTGAIVDANPRVCAVYGYSHQELLTLHPGSLGTGEPPYTADDASRWIRRAKDGGVVRTEWHRRNRDGSTAWDELTLKRVTLSGVDRILAVSRDITERKEREHALARSEERLRATVEAALDCIITMDSGGRIRDFNPAAELCFGYRAEDVRGRPLADLIIPARYRRAHREGLERYLRDNVGRLLGRRIQLVAMHADGNEFPVELAIGVAEDENEKLFIGYLRDITEQRDAERAHQRLEAQLRQAQKMEAIGHLTGGIAHDFNNILTGIMGYLVMASEVARDLPDPKLGRYLARARHSGARAMELIQQMLTFSRGQRGNPHLVNAEPLVRDALKLIRSTLPASVELAVDLDPGAPQILADPVQIEQVLMNLCINARDAMNGQGLLHIAMTTTVVADAVCAACHEPVHGRYLQVSATDTGPGVPDVLLPRIFDPFYSTKAPGEGSGMGLATVHGIVHEHRGHILVRNVPEAGAEFRVLLPVASNREDDARSAVAGTVTVPGTAGGLPVLHGCMLLVDDDAVAREFMVERLESWGLEVLAFANPAAALDGVRRRATRPDLAILDYTMPQMTGVELAPLLRAQYPGLPVLLYSGFPGDLAPDGLQQAGIVAMLKKPVDSEVLLRRLRELLEPDHG